MTRARARALKTEVTSLLSKISYDPLETWLLPQSGMLCMIRYQEDPPEDAHEDGQDPKSKEEVNQWKKAKEASTHRTSAQGPGHPVPREPPDIRPDARTSGAPACAQPLWAEPVYPFAP